MAFVNVPDIPGVPNVNFAPGILGTGVALLSEDAFSLRGLQTFQFGIYLNGAPAVIADTVVEMDYRREWTIGDYPIEKGNFESFDKVQLPRDVRLRFAAGSAAGRAELLASLGAIDNTTTVFDVVTPDAVYTSLTISHEDYRRSAIKGAGLLQVEVWCLEVRQNAAGGAGSTSSAATVNPGSADPINDGNVIPVTTPTPTGVTPLGQGGIGSA